MLKTVRNQLILLYTCSTGLILTIVLLLVLVNTNQQILNSRRGAFQNNYRMVNQSVQINNEISNLWLAELEMKNKFVIHIEENGIPLQYRGSWNCPTDRNILVERLKEVALKDNVNTNIRPVSKKEIQSKLYEFKGNRSDSYLGEIYIIPTNSGYRSVVMIQYISGSSAEEVKQKIFIAFIDIIGIIMLFAISRWFVGKTLLPVEESKKRQVEFIAAASHELKSPLAVIRASSSAIMLEPEKASHFTKGIDMECERLAELIEDMLLLANADANNWKMRMELIDIETILIETYDTFAPFCRKHGKQLHLELQEELLPKIQGDSMRLKQILAVLIDNAVTYSKKDDTILLRAYTRKRNLLIEVEDHGIGIENSKKSEVFERFYCVDRSRRDKNHYGLGLSIAKELVELHSGNISVKDTPGGGATFHIDLPVKNSEKR
ncbi:MAG TPA: HAMP domain-containing sensor histidine kinase [Lachnospiraceae bacterium]|nr:HAMP domain-containing sensor histidine kinase [Lachnospiraceae bacterium]